MNLGRRWFIHRRGLDTRRALQFGGMSLFCTLSVWVGVIEVAVSPAPNSLLRMLRIKSIPMTITRVQGTRTS